MRRNSEELQETDSSWRNDFDLLSLCFGTVCVKLLLLLSQHRSVLKLDIHSAVLLSYSHTENKKKEC